MLLQHYDVTAAKVTLKSTISNTPGHHRWRIHDHSVVFLRRSHSRENATLARNRTMLRAYCYRVRVNQAKDPRSKWMTEIYLELQSWTGGDEAALFLLEICFVTEDMQQHQWLESLEIMSSLIWVLHPSQSINICTSSVESPQIKLNNLWTADVLPNHSFPEAIPYYRLYVYPNCSMERQFFIPIPWS